jgi:hypothetical protein
MNYQLVNETKMTQQRIRELEHHIEIREKELCDVQEAYAEKVRKCDGWEKVSLPHTATHPLVREMSLSLRLTTISVAVRQNSRMRIRVSSHGNLMR